jgi:quercetin dioxygenase-like cupin family protein
MAFINLHEIKAKEPFPGITARFVHSQNMTFGYWDIEAGKPFPEHSHPHEQIGAIMEGEVELTINGETKVLGPGSVAIIPPNAIHSGKVITRSRIIDVFYPVREDYR